MARARMPQTAADAVTRPMPLERRMNSFALRDRRLQGMKDGDGFFCLNFRADRARQILRALGEPGFSAFDVGRAPI
jgi:bisphosphoglycerate-independent phosphoglycerate mutase (AlkP superfamily)